MYLFTVRLPCFFQCGYPRPEMTIPLYRALAVLSIAVLATADPDGLTNCGETSTVPGLIGENTTVSFPIAGTCKTVIANYADGSEESISVEPSDCDRSNSPSESQVYQITFGSLSPRGVASILFNCNGGLQVFCQRYNITAGDGLPAQATTNITAMCNETTTYPLLSSGGLSSGIVAATPVGAGQTPSTLLTATSTPLQGPHGTTDSNSATESPAGPGQSQDQSAGGTSGPSSMTETPSPTSQNSGTSQPTDGGNSPYDGGGSGTSDGAASSTPDGGGSGIPGGGGSGTRDGGASLTSGVATSPSSAVPSITAAAEQSTRSPINTPNSPYVPLTPQSSCTCTC